MTKMTVPMIEDKRVVGTQITYRFFGVKVYMKIIHFPFKYGIEEWDYYSTSI